MWRFTEVQRPLPLHDCLTKRQTVSASAARVEEVEVGRVVFTNIISHRDLEINGMYTTPFPMPRFDHKSTANRLEHPLERRNRG